MNYRWLGGLALVSVLASPFLTKAINRRKVAVSAQHPVERQIESSILTSGNFVYDGQVELSPEIIGRVLHVFAKEGDRVTAGQVLLEIDPSTYRAAYDQQLAAYEIQQQRLRQQQVVVETERLRFARTAALFKMSFSTKAQFEDAQLALTSSLSDIQTIRLSIEQSKATLDQTRVELAKTSIRSPVSGFVTALNIKVGETAVPSTIGIQGSSLITIAKDRSMLLELSVDESDVAQVKVGQRVSIHPVSYPDTTFDGRVTFVSLAPRRSPFLGGAGQNSRSYTVKVAFQSPGRMELKPSMTCRAEVFTDTSKPLLTIPIQAAFSDDGGEAAERIPSPTKPQHYVFVLRGNEAHRQPVELGVADDNYVSVKSGLSAKDEVFIGPYKTVKFLTEGESISPTLVGASTK